VERYLILLRKSEEGLSEIALQRFAARARRAAKLKGDLAVLITGNREIRKLNLIFRKKDKPTDVISFPSDMEGVAGDIAISIDIARQNGLILGHGTLPELKILILHGILHLKGMDHEKDSGQMARREMRLRRELGLPEGLIERSNGKRRPAKRRAR
jgi:probable rRNA maturation factor